MGGSGGAERVALTVKVLGEGAGPNRVSGVCVCNNRQLVCFTNTRSLSRVDTMLSPTR